MTSSIFFISKISAIQSKKHYYISGSSHGSPIKMCELFLYGTYECALIIGCLTHIFHTNAIYFSKNTSNSSYLCISRYLSIIVSISTISSPLHNFIRSSFLSLGKDE